MLTPDLHDLLSQEDVVQRLGNCLTMSGTLPIESNPSHLFLGDEAKCTMTRFWTVIV
jgi:hypothetical protein